MSSEPVPSGELADLLPALEEPYYGYSFYNESHRPACDLVGLDHESLVRTDAAFSMFHEKCWYHPYYEGTSQYKYVPIISFAENIFGNIGDKTVVEIGAGDTGTIPLAYFASRGAQTFGFDCQKPSSEAEKFMKEHGVTFVSGKWEEVGSYFPPDSVDLIYVKFMIPNPETGGNCSRPGREYDRRISSEMRKILKLQGFFVLSDNNSQETPLEYYPDPNILVDDGYSYHLFRLPGYAYGGRFHIFQRDDKPPQARNFFY